MVRVIHPSSSVSRVLIQSACTSKYARCVVRPGSEDPLVDFAEFAGGAAANDVKDDVVVRHRYYTG